MIVRRVIITSVLIALLVFELLVLLFLVLFPYVTDPGFAAFNNSVYTFLAPLSPVLLLGTLYAWLISLVTREVRRRVAKFNSLVEFLSKPFQKIISSVNTVSLSRTTEEVLSPSRPWLVLITSLVASVLLAFIPYRPDLNPTGSLVGVDSQLYAGWINQMLALSFPQAIRYSFVQGFDGSRPLLLLPLYLVGTMGVAPSTIIEYLPTALAPLLSLSVYVFVLYGQRNSSLAGLTSLFTTFSFYTTVGLWGGYYANWLALILAFWFMRMLLVFSKSPSVRNYVIMFVLSLGLFLTHPWTWTLVLAVSLTFALTVWRDTREVSHLKSIIGIIITGIILDIIKGTVFATRTVAADIATKTPSSIGFLLGFWNNLVQALLYTGNGLMADWLILGLALLATFLLSSKEMFDRLLLLWTAVPSIPFLVLDSYNQSRIIYDLPTPVLTTLMVLILVSQIRNRLWPRLIVALMLLTITNYSLQALIQL